MGPGATVGVLGNGGPQTCLPAACGVAQRGPSTAHLHQHKTQDPREGPSLAGWTMQGFLRGDLTRQAREEAERSRKGTPRGARDASHDDQDQAGARRAPACAVSLFPFGAKGASTCQGIRQRLPFRCNETKTSREARWRSPWSPRRRHHQSLWQAKTTFCQDNLYSLSPFEFARVVGSLPAQYLGRGPGPI